MTIELLFGTQIVTLLAYLGLVFYLYRLLVKQKDAAIDSKNATIELLREKANSLKEQLEQAKQSSPDILVESLSKRLERLNDEFKALSQDHDAKEEVLAKDKEIKKAEAMRLQLEKIIRQLAEEPLHKNQFVMMMVRQGWDFEKVRAAIQEAHSLRDFIDGLRKVEGKADKVERIFFDLRHMHDARMDFNAARRILGKEPLYDPPESLDDKR